MNFSKLFTFDDTKKSDVRVWRRICALLLDTTVYAVWIGFHKLLPDPFSLPYTVIFFLYWIVDGIVVPRITGYSLSRWVFGYKLVNSVDEYPSVIMLLLRNFILAIEVILFAVLPYIPILCFSFLWTQSVNEPIANIIATITIVIAISFPLFILVRKDHRGFHDCITRSVTVKSKPRKIIIRVIVSLIVFYLSTSLGILEGSKEMYEKFCAPQKNKCFSEFRALKTTYCTQFPLNSINLQSVRCTIPEQPIVLYKEKSENIKVADSLLYINEDVYKIKTTINHAHYPLDPGINIIGNTKEDSARIKISSMIYKLLGEKRSSSQILSEILSHYPRKSETQFRLFHPLENLKTVVNETYFAVCTPSFASSDYSAIITGETAGYAVINYTSERNTVVVFDLWKGDVKYEIVLYNKKYSPLSAKYLISHIGLLE